MDSRSRRIAGAGPLLAGWLAFAMAGVAATARAQDTGKDAGARPGGGQDKGKAGAKKGGAAAARGDAPRREPSPEFQEGIRKTVEKRRQRRARRAQAMGTAEAHPPGAIVPWPMPPALIIRQTPEVHGEVDSLLGQLRRGS
jgi:hypothetical protein